MYNERDPGYKSIFLREESTKMCPSRPEEVDLPSVCHIEDNNILKGYKVDATIADHP
jgi:hypothetical protein